MFFIGAIIILIVSFLIALVSLLREQRRVHKISQQHHGAVSMDKVDPQPAASSVEPTPPVPEEVAPEPIEEPAKAPEVSTESEAARVDEEVVPFPWEIKAGADDAVSQPQVATMSADDRFPNVSNSLPSEPVFDQAPAPTTQDSSGQNSVPVLNGSISLKDLQK